FLIGISFRYLRIRKNLLSSDGRGISVPSKSRNAAMFLSDSFTSFISLTPFCVFMPPPVLNSSRRAPAPRCWQSISTPPPKQAAHAAGKTQPSSTSGHAPPRESWRAHPPPVHPAARPARASRRVPAPNNRNTGTSSPHTNRGSSATPRAPAPTTCLAWHSRPSRNALLSSPVRAENPSPPRAQKTTPASTPTHSQQPRHSSK